MSKVLGFSTKPDGESFPVVFSNVSLDDQLTDIAEGKTEDGTVDQMTAISRTKTLSFDGEVNGDLGSLAAGQVIEYDSEEFLIKSAKLSQTAGKYQTFSCSAERKDDATITGFDAPTP